MPQNRTRLIALGALLAAALSADVVLSQSDVAKPEATALKGIVRDPSEQPRGSYLFALFVSEGLLLALGIGLRFWYRLSYHLFLALFFLYPLAVLPFLVQSWNKFLPWMLFGFSLATSLAVLTLLPAVRRGADYVKNNGTPWRWPYFPWSLFVILGVAAGLRHYYLCLS